MMRTNSTPVKHPKRKILFTLFLTILMIAAFVVILVIQNTAMFRLSMPKKEALRTEAIRNAAEDIGFAWMEADERIEEIYRVSADLYACAEQEVPEANDRAADRTALVEQYVNFQGIMLRPEAVCGGYALLVREDPASGSGYHVVFKNDLISDDTDLYKAGLTWEAIQNGETKKPTVTLGRTAYSCSVSKVPETDGYLVMLIPKENLIIKSISQSTYTMALMILLLYGFVVSGSSLCSYVRKNALSQNMEEMYRPGNIRRFATLCGVIGVITIAFSGWLDQSLNNLYDFSVRSRDVLAAVEKNIEIHDERNARDAQVVERVYLSFGNIIAEILNDRPEMRSGDTLRSLCDRIGASSITLYDAQGKETACSGDYIDLELGRDPHSATWEFRRILKGAPSLFREAETDEETGLNEVRLGIRINDPAEDGKYGVMIIALDPSMLQHDVGEEINRILADMTTSDTKLWISDFESGLVLASGDRKLIGTNVKDLGIDELELRDALMRELRTDEGNFYIASSILGGQILEGAESAKSQIAFYVESLDAKDYGIFSIVLSCIAFLMMYSVLHKICLSDYTEEFWNENKHIGIRTDRDTGEKHSAEPGQNSIFGLKSLRKKMAASWSALSPGKKGLYAIELIAVLFLLERIPLPSLGNEYARDTVYYNIAAGNWSRGLNLFALAAIVDLAAEILLGVIVVQMLLKGISMFAGTKGKTVCRLLSSFIRYVALFIFLILGASCLGVDRATIITATGAFSLALSLGAQDLIGDVISGIAIVFEGNFHVGEIVQISDRTGKVLEIGIRCTKILEQDGAVLIISNRMISQVVNMTQHSSWYTCEFTVPSSVEIEELERMLQEELPKIGEGDMQILSGPVYQGVTSFGNDTVTLSISTECSRDDYDDVRQKVNRELQRLFRRKGIPV